MVRRFSLLIHILVVKDYELPKCADHVLNVPLTVECVKNVDPAFFFLINCLPDDVLGKVAIWADDTALNSSCDKPSDLSQQVEITYDQ